MKIAFKGAFFPLYIAYLLVALTFCACKPNTIHFNKLGKPAAIVSPAPIISSIQVVNNQIVITGSNLNFVQTFSIREGAATTSMTIESKSNSSIVANTLSNVTFAAGKVFDFILSDADAASTFTVNFSLCDSDLNGKGFNCSVAPNDKDVLSFDANSNKWVPRNVNGLSYKGTHSAAGGADPGGSPTNGDYYIISAPGTINSISYSIGDWIVYNSDDSTWQKISNSQDVISVFGRTGKVSAKEGDYNLTKLSDVDTTTTPPALNNVLRFNGTNWVPGTVSMSETDPTVAAFAKSAPPTCAAGQVLRSNGTSLSCVADGSFTGTANRVVTTNGSGALTISTITDTLLGYLSGLTGNVQTQLNNKADAAAIVDYSVAGLPLVHPTRVYGGATQASKTLITDGTGAITTSAVTPTELGYLSGATSNIQTQINTLSGSGLWVKTGNDVSYSAGKVGIGVTTPVESFETTGAIKVGTTATTCTSANRGSIRYNTISNALEYCNGSGWNLVQAASCSDPTPDAFAFNNEANATTSSLVTSNIIQITGINCSTAVTISGSGSPQYQICSDSSCSTVVQGWTTGTSSILNNQYIQTRLTSGVAGGSTNKATIIVGSAASVWTVTATGDCTGSPVPGTICADGTVYAGVTPDGSLPMYTTKCDAGMTWDGSNCTGSRLGIEWNNGLNFPTNTGFISLSQGEGNTIGLVGLSDAGAPYNAANYCANLTENGLSDWYLPAFNEVIVLYNNRTEIQNFVPGTYWSSSEGAANTARYLRFNDGGADSFYKTDGRYVRCVRK